MPIQVVMPQLGESVVEGTVTQWLVREGDVVTREQPLVEIATDKADSEVPSPQTGRIGKVLAAVGQVVKVGQALCDIELEVGIDAAAPAAPAPAAPAPAAPAPAAPVPTPAARAASASAAPAPADHVSAAANGTLPSRGSPIVRKLALERGVDVASIEGSGARGRVTSQDVLRAAEAVVPTQGVDPELVALLNSGALVAVPNVGFASYKVPPYRPKPGDEVVPFSRRRRLTAHHMVYSKWTAPHVVTVAEVDLLRVSKLRDAHKDRYKREGVPLTVLSFVCHAAVRALREYPVLNARVQEDSYVLLKDVNLGVAVDAPDGLIVPNVKRADELSLRGLARVIDETAQRARTGKITADDLSGGSFSVSNPGIRGNLFGGAIIAQPNVGILRMGEIQKRPVVVEVEGQDTIAIHPIMFMALSYDHRIIDGVMGNSFLYRVTEILEKGDFEV